MYHDIFKWKSDFGWPEIITAASSIATAAMVVYTHFTLKATQKSQEAAQRSAEATEKSVERMKDTQMPYFSLGVSNSNEGFYLNLRNVGPGLGKIRLVSIRDDLKVNCVLDEPLKFWTGKPSQSNKEIGTERIVDFAVASNDEYTFRFDFSPQYPFGGWSWMSSLSVFYEDVYGRLFRSRILYQWDPSNNYVHSVGTEVFAIEHLPIESTSNYDIRLLYDLEGEKPITYRPDYRMFYRIKFTSSIQDTRLQGTSLTEHKNILLRKISIPWHGYPEFLLQIDEYQPFQIKPKFRESELVGYSIQGNFSDYGLRATGNDDPLISELYQSIVRELMKLKC